MLNLWLFYSLVGQLHRLFWLPFLESAFISGSSLPMEESSSTPIGLMALAGSWLSLLQSKFLLLRWSQSSTTPTLEDPWMHLGPHMNGVLRMKCWNKSGLSSRSIIRNTSTKALALCSAKSFTVNNLHLTMLQWTLKQRTVGQAIHLTMRPIRRTPTMV